MKNFSNVVVDANLVVSTVVDSELTPQANRVMQKFLSSHRSLYAPGLWSYETTSVIRKYWFIGQLTKEEAENALELLNLLPIHLLADTLRLRQTALRWASLLRQKAAYDGFYLAAAEQLDADLWTADHSLFNNAQQLGLHWVHWMGELSE